MPSLKRSMSLKSSSEDTPPASFQRRSTLARNARYSAASWMMSNPLRARRSACVSAAVSDVSRSSGARPMDLRVWASSVWGRRMSRAIACRICLAWSRRASDFISAAAGSCAAANVSHSSKIASISNWMKSGNLNAAPVQEKVPRRCRLYLQHGASCCWVCSSFSDLALY